ncbi:MAG TPA: alcohol acetyltransferase, partial [Spirochaetia bacterium]|nr:alcohol acetyltransferase [Spirochaetia bacterium]
MNNDSHRQDLRREWYRLDNAATLFSLITSPSNTCLFRIEAELKRPVVLKNLQRALDNIIERFPYYRVHLVPGLFWHFWNTSGAKPLVIADTNDNCEVMPVTKPGIFPFRVRAFRNRVAMEFHHSLTDGTGGMIFVKALLAEYLALSGT